MRTLKIFCLGLCFPLGIYTAGCNTLRYLAATDPAIAGLDAGLATFAALITAVVAAALYQTGIHE